LTNYEVVGLKISLLNNDTSVLAGKNITISIDGEADATYPIVNNWCEFKVPKSYLYTIKYPDATGYTKPAPRTIEASLDYRTVVTERCFNSSENTKLVDSSGNEYTLAEFDANPNKETIKPELVAIHINTQLLNQIASSGSSLSGKCDFYIDLSKSWIKRTWRDTLTQFNCLPNEGTWDADPSLPGNESLIDGLSNTYLIKDELSQLSQASAVVEYVTPMTLSINNIGTLRGFCMSIRQFKELIDNYDYLVSIYTYLGKTLPTIKNDGWWSSTQDSASIMWGMNNGSPSTWGYFKYNSYYVFPVFA